MEDGGWIYLVHYILERVGAVDSEADKQEVGLGVGEGTKSIIFFLPCGIPEGQLDGLARRWVNRICDIVFEDCWDVFLAQVSTRLSARSWRESIPLESILGCKR